RLGIDLASRGRCEAARAPLKKALALYRQENDDQGSRELLFGYIDEIFVFLTGCDAALGDYAAYLGDLRAQAKNVARLRDAEISQPAADLRRGIRANLEGLSFTLSLLQPLDEHFESLQQGNARFPEKVPERPAFTSALDACR